MEEASATAEGELGRTPLAHLLVYALDRRLTGAIFLKPPRGSEHVMRLVQGVPVKVRPGDGFALLGEMLLEAGVIDVKTLEDALATKGLLGDVLLLAGRIERDALEKLAEAQFQRRMVRLFALPPETTYRYYEDHAELAEYGGDAAAVDPLVILWAGLRIHGDVSSMMEGTLARIGDAPLRLHPAATVSRFGLDADEARLLEALGARPLTLAELSALAFPGMARRFAYALAITRQLELGTASVPLGAEVAPTSSLRPQAAASTAVARLALRSTVHRLGAAAPDTPGDGERRAPVVTSRRNRERPSQPSASDELPSSRTSTLPPISSVEDVDGSMRARDSGVVAVEPQREAPPEAPAQPVNRATLVESATMRSQIAPSLGDLRAAVSADLALDSGVAISPGGDAAPLASAAEGADAPAIAVAQEEAPEADDPFAAMSAPELFWLASECLAERDFHGAVEACDAGRREAPDDPDLVALGAWARAQLGAADLKALAIALDEVLGAHEAHVEARYYRGMLRKRLGDEAGSLRDLRHVVEIAPGHEGACHELSALETKEDKDRPSLFGRLFKR